MPEAQAATPQAGKPKKEKAEAAPKQPKVNRSNFSKLYPEDAPLKLLVEENPKKQGSKARERFDHYFKSKTVGDYLAAGGTYQDIAYDVGRSFVQVG